MFQVVSVFFSDVNISQGSVATYVRCDGILIIFVSEIYG